MTWAPYQLERIKIEDVLIRRYFPTFQFSYHNDIFSWKGWMCTNNNNYYEIKIVLPPNFPEDVPRAYITRPYPIYDFKGTLLSSLGTSHNMHTFRSDNEFVRLCIFRPERWSSDITVYKCLKKVRLWIEAFDRHKKTGELMCDLLGTQY